MLTACKIITLALLVVIALVTAAHGEAVVGVPFGLTVGETITVDGVTIGFEAVPTDGRCPIGLLCFWEGDAACQLWAQEKNTERTRLVIHTSSFFGREATYGDWTIRLMALDPYPVYERPPAPESYVVTLTVARGALLHAEESSWSRIKALYR